MITLRQYDEAEQHLRRAIDLDPTYTNSRVGLAQVLFLRGKYADALTICEQLVKDEPENAGFWLVAGRLCEAMGKFEQAAAAYRHALDLQPDLEEARLRLENLQRH